MSGKVKRSRIPSTHKDIHVLDQDIEYVRNNFSSKISISEQQQQQQPVVCSSDAQPPRKKILTVNKMTARVSDRFYEFCHYCKDYISENADVFMYGYLVHIAPQHAEANKSKWTLQQRNSQMLLGGVVDSAQIGKE